MKELRWLKQQDFCLRLGLLKAVVALLGPSRGSQTRDAVRRRIDSEVFVELTRFPEVHSAVARSLNTDPPKQVDSLASGLLILSGAQSWGQPIRINTSYKVLEWAQIMGLVGSGNRVTERGLLLHGLFDGLGAQRLSSERMISWNPFRLTDVERALFLFHLMERDELTGRLLVAAGLCGAGTVLDADAIRRLTSEQLDGLVKAADHRVSMSQMGPLRTLKELASVIRWETGNGPRPRKPPTPSARSIPKRRRATKTGPGAKNADHQSVPRMEQLTDLGLFEKDVSSDLEGTQLIRARNAWKYRVTSAAESIARRIADPETLVDPAWVQREFAATVGRSGLFRAGRRASFEEGVRLVSESYAAMRRGVGHTPLESVALMAVVSGLGQGVLLELYDVHRLFMGIKTGRALQGTASFAAGNELDRMFIKLGDDFESAAISWIAKDPNFRWGI